MAVNDKTDPVKKNDLDHEALKLQEDVKRVEQEKAELAQQKEEIAQQKAELERLKAEEKTRKAAEKADAKKQKTDAKKQKAEEKRLQQEAERQAKDAAAAKETAAKQQAKIQLPEYFTKPSQNDRDRRLQHDLAFSWLCGMAGEKVTYSAQITYLGPRRKASRVAWKGIAGRPAKKGRWYIERTPIYFFRREKLPHLIKDPAFILEALQHKDMWLVEFIQDAPGRKDEAIAHKLLDNRAKHLNKNLKQRRDLILLSKIKAPLRQGEAEQVLQFAQTHKITISDEIKTYLLDKIKEYNR